MWYKSSFQFSLQKGAKPSLRKSKLLFHKEWIALVFEKVKRAIHSFCSCCSLKKSNRERFAIIPLYKKSTRAKEHKREFPTLIYLQHFALLSVQRTWQLWLHVPVHRQCEYSTVFPNKYWIKHFSHDIQLFCVNKRQKNLFINFLGLVVLLFW